VNNKVRNLKLTDLDNGDIIQFTIEPKADLKSIGVHLLNIYLMLIDEGNIETKPLKDNETDIFRND
jgi:hypothetical protein